MKNAPNNLSVGHALAYLYIYFAKYGDGTVVQEELQAIHEIITDWMGKDSSYEENKQLLMETWDWFESGSNFERAQKLDGVINLIKTSDAIPKEAIPSIATDLSKIAQADRDLPKSELDLFYKILNDLGIELTKS